MAFNNKKKAKTNYFSQNIQENGENFLDYKNAQDMLKDAARIIKDLANENIDINKYYYFFQEPKVIDACIQYVWTQLQEFAFISMSIDFSINNRGKGVIPDPISMSLQNKYRNKKDIFEHIYNSLSYYKACGDVNILYVLAKTMNNNRYYINN